MKIVDMVEKVFQMRTFKDGINVISKSFPNLWRVQFRSYSSAFIRDEKIFTGNKNFHRISGNKAIFLFWPDKTFMVFSLKHSFNCYGPSFTKKIPQVW